MPPSVEAHNRFRNYVQNANATASHPLDNDRLYAFVAYVLVHEPDALNDHAGFAGLMAEYHFGDSMQDHVFGILDAAPGLIEAYERERARQ